MLTSKGPFFARFPAATTGTLVGHKGHLAQCTCTFSADLGLPSARNWRSSSSQHHTVLLTNDDQEGQLNDQECIGELQERRSAIA